MRFLLITVLCLLLPTACGIASAPSSTPSIPTSRPTPTAQAQVGVVEGTVSIGPLVPVQQANQPTPTTSPEIYAAWPIGIFQADGETPVTPLTVDAGGAYRVELPPGTYVVTLMARPRIGGSNLPQTITLEAGQTVTLDIVIDTGIR